MFTCLRNFCEWSSCPAHPDAKCRVNPCGGCKVEFVNKDGNVVNCEKGNINLCEDYVATKFVSSPGAGGITQQTSVIYTFSQGKKQSSCGKLLSDAKFSEPAIT